MSGPSIAAQGPTQPLLRTLAAVLIAAAFLAPAAAAQPAPADVAFMRAMIPHHRQALVMTALVGERALDGRVRRLAGRIEVSQNDEIAWMERKIRETLDPFYGYGGPAVRRELHAAGSMTTPRLEATP